MKQLFLGLLCCLSGAPLFAKDGYTIKVNFKQHIPDHYVYLAHYYAKSFPTVYKVDSAEVVNGNKAVFQNKDSVLGGIYMVLYKKNSKTAEFLLDNGDKFEMTIDTSGMPKGISFKGSQQNGNYVAYEEYLHQYGQQREALVKEIKTAKNAADSQRIEDEAQRLSDELTDFRKKSIQQNPNTLFAALLKTLIMPEAPKGTHYLADGKTVDSNFAYNFYKDHYWDNFDFSDSRLMFAPIYEPRLKEYFSRIILPVPDTVNAEADKLLAKARKSKEIFKYTLYWLANYAETSRIMGMDEVFVHLVENYYMKGDAFWLDSAQLAKYEDRAKKIAPNVIGNPAPKLDLQDIWTLQDKPLDDVRSPYTLVVFWSPTCGHCQKEIPLIDSVYNSALKQKGVTVYSVPVEGNLTDIQKFVEKDHIRDWINVVDAHNKSNFKDNYDVYSTPQVYLLDKNKTIIGKKLDHSNILDVINWNEKQKAKDGKG
ncbi:MAG TPA: thioredoxin-like domain-containing protein [Edaphocola sp.]|nr:thioredoxin-like domain-containing protein [Edaphocola sp.]